MILPNAIFMTQSKKKKCAQEIYDEKCLIRATKDEEKKKTTRNERTKK